MTWHETPSSILRFSPLVTEPVKPKVWFVAALLGSALLVLVIPLLQAKNSAKVTEQALSYAGSGLLNSNQIVTLVATTIQHHSGDPVTSKKLVETSMRDNRAGKFSSVQSSLELANLLTKREREISRDDHYQVLYSSAPPDIAEAHGRSIYRITEHLSVALPSL